MMFLPAGISLPLTLLLSLKTVEAFSFSPNAVASVTRIRPHTQLSSSSSSSSKSSSTTPSTSPPNKILRLNPVFDFTGHQSEDQKQKSISSFERIDDAIMGGISLSALKDVPSQPYASWSGVCRTDGGGFCGMRTLPFTEPLRPTVMGNDVYAYADADGVYVDCRLASDDEPQRRVWKMTVRTDTSRGEQVYQAEFDLAAASASLEPTNEQDGWARVKVPFHAFRMVRGPRMIPDSPPLDLSGGIFQIGMTLSKFVLGVNTTELPDFRPGYFDLHLRQIGFYKDVHVDASVDVETDVNVETEIDTETVAEDESVSAMDTDTDEDEDEAVEEEQKQDELVVLETTEAKIPDTLTKEQSLQKRPLLLRLLFPIVKLLFSEQANRRRSAMNILRDKRNMTRTRAILFGVRNRSKSIGLLPSIAKTCAILSVDSTRAIVKTLLKFVFVYPLRVVGAIVRNVKKALGMKVKPSLRE